MAYFDDLLDKIELEENSSEDLEQNIIKIQITATTDGGFGYKDSSDIFLDTMLFGYNKEEWESLDLHDRPGIVRNMIKDAVKKYDN